MYKNAIVILLVLGLVSAYSGVSISRTIASPIKAATAITGSGSSSGSSGPSTGHDSDSSTSTPSTGSGISGPSTGHDSESYSPPSSSSTSASSRTSSSSSGSDKGTISIAKRIGPLQISQSAIDAIKDSSNDKTDPTDPSTGHDTDTVTPPSNDGSDSDSSTAPSTGHDADSYSPPKKSGSSKDRIPSVRDPSNYQIVDPSESLVKPANTRESVSDDSAISVSGSKGKLVVASDALKDIYGPGTDNSGSSSGPSTGHDSGDVSPPSEGTGSSGPTSGHDSGSVSPPSSGSGSSGPSTGHDNEGAKDDLIGSISKLIGSLFKVLGFAGS